MSVLVHEKSYKGKSIVQVIHRSRLKKLIAILKDLELNDGSIWADFGCSNGFILSLIQNEVVSNNWSFYGFDHKAELLEMGRQKQLQNTEFHQFDLNIINYNFSNFFDVVTCFETLEHTGNYKNAFENLYISCKVNGLIVISIPNETGVPGMLKFFGRKLKRRNVYGDFFGNKSELNYISQLLRGGNIELFRDRERTGWGPHLGFDYRSFEDFLTKGYIAENKCVLLNKHSSFLNFNRFYIIKKVS